MANLLLDPNNWKDQSGSGVSPPACWNGTSYVAVNQEEDLSLIPDVTVGDVLSCMLSNTGGIGTVYVNSNSGTLAHWTPTTTPTLFSVDVTGAQGLGLQIDSGLGCSSDTITMTPTAEPLQPPTRNCDCNDTTGNKALKQLRDDLARRLGFGAQVNNLPPGMTDLLNSFLIEAQEILYRRYDVLRTERFYSWFLQAGVTLYDLDGNSETCTKRLDPRKITWVGVERDNIWYPLVCGIPPELYSRNTTGWRPERYEIRQCIEVWPTPDATAGSLVIKGHFGLEAFAADTDTATIDDRLIFLLALANAKAHYGKSDANNYIAQMESMMMDLVAGAHQTRRYVPGRDNRFDRIYVEPKPLVPFPT